MSTGQSSAIQVLNVQQTKEMIIHAGRKVIDSKERLTEIDSAIGDGDHGIGMALGFTKAIGELTAQEPSTVNDVFKTTGMAMLNSMGGASGVIFGTMFMSGASKVEPAESLSLSTLTRIFENALTAIKARGKAQPGDKTMVDALEPAVEALKEGLSQSRSMLEALRAAEAGALEGVEKTKGYIAKFGRARSLGERAVGCQDAGATTVSVIFGAFREWLEEAGKQ